MAAMNDPNLFPFSYGFEFFKQITWKRRVFYDGRSEHLYSYNTYISIELFSFFRDWHYGIDSMLKQGWACMGFRKLRVKMQENEVMME